mmetsp:Transcript_11616/g.40035  ORF Transcript_11616/g.40035 Transcript_11616/m.40035 type:complete len:226 (-) Transcript_11616:420-1097(-)
MRAPSWLCDRPQRCLRVRWAGHEEHRVRGWFQVGRVSVWQADAAGGRRRSCCYRQHPSPLRQRLSPQERLLCRLSRMGPRAQRLLLAMLRRHVPVASHHRRFRAHGRVPGEEHARGRGLQPVGYRAKDGANLHRHAELVDGLVALPRHSHEVVLHRSEARRRLQLGHLLLLPALAALPLRHRHHPPGVLRQRDPRVPSRHSLPRLVLPRPWQSHRPQRLPLPHRR